MEDLTDRLARDIHGKMRMLGFSTPSLLALRFLLRTAYLASLKTEEGRFVRGSITFANPKRREEAPPPIRRADYPLFTVLKHKHPFNVELIVKLARAFDVWSSSIAVYGTTPSNMNVWGVVDQLVQLNTRMNREKFSGFSNPGILTVVMNGIGDISVYHREIFLGAMRSHEIVSKENDAFSAQELYKRIAPNLVPASIGIARAVDKQDESEELLSELYDAWKNTVARLCIGLRRLGTGGSFIITPTTPSAMLNIGYRLPYKRLGDSFILGVLDSRHDSDIGNERMKYLDSENVPGQLVIQSLLAEADTQDRESEVTGAVKIVTSLASVDGAVLLNPLLQVIGFGVKIGSGASAKVVYDGPDFIRRGARAKTINLARFGTRHSSMLRYCKSDPSAVGIVVSQDGHVRLVVTVGRSLTFWDNVKLMQYEDYSASLARSRRAGRIERQGTTRRQKLGYTSTPKTLSALLGGQ